MPVHLRLDEDEVDEEHHEVVLDVLVAEAAAVATDGQADVVAGGFVAGAGAPEGVDGVAAFDADGHFGKALSGDHCGLLWLGV